MNWEERLLSEAELSSYLDVRSAHPLSDLASALLKHQQEHWPMMKEGYESFGEVRLKKFSPDPEGGEIYAQYNARRIRSTSAAVDVSSVEQRQCFLCASNLPAEEKGIEYGRDLIMLCNPFPVLDKHLSIVHREHVDQRINGNVETLLALAQDLGSEFFVLYNGPACGASAPDHLHFQACSRNLFPIGDALKLTDSPDVEECGICSSGRQDFELFTLSDNRRTAIVFRGNNSQEISDWIYSTLREMPVAEGNVEPMVNVICAWESSDWTVYVFPRTRHRPSFYFTKEMVISPGAIDMAGVLVLPREEDFEKMTEEYIGEIYSEVSISEDEAGLILERLGLSETAEEPA